MEFTVLSAHSHHLLQTDDILLSVQNATLVQEKRAAAPHPNMNTCDPTKGPQGANKPFPHRSRWLRVHMQDGQAELAVRVPGAERVVMPHENHHFYSSINTAPAGVPATPGSKGTHMPL